MNVDILPVTDCCSRPDFLDTCSYSSETFEKECSGNLGARSSLAFYLQFIGIRSTDPYSDKSIDSRWSREKVYETEQALSLSPRSSLPLSLSLSPSLLNDTESYRTHTHTYARIEHLSLVNCV